MTLETVFEKASILVIDDEKANVRLLEIILCRAGYSNIYSTIDSRQSLALFRDSQPDIVLLDLAMPHMDGFAVMEQLHQEMAGNSVPILVLTADVTSTTKHKALQGGAKDYITKPLDEIEVLLRIHNLLETRLHSVLLETRVRERTQELENSREQLRALTASLSAMIEEERTQISRNVHDVLGQALTKLKMDVAWVEEKLITSRFESDDPIRQKTSFMLQCLETTIESVQQIAANLRPALLDDCGLEAAIEWQLQDFRERSHIECDYVSSLGDIQLPPELETSVFRILQEALTNIVRHASASKVSILLEENAGQLVLEVQDNGRGMSEPVLSTTGTKSLGLLGMQERARLVGGEVIINSLVGKGTTVTVRVPLHSDGNL